jgi:hypothetical protein
MEKNQKCLIGFRMNDKPWHNIIIGMQKKALRAIDDAER